MLSRAKKPIMIICSCLESGQYRPIVAVKGDTIIMSCKTSSPSGVEWTRNTTDGHYSIVYANGTIRGHHNILLQFSVVNPKAGDYSLKIYNVHPTDSGLYDCYDTDGMRLAGYYLVAEGTFPSRPLSKKK